MRVRYGLFLPLFALGLLFSLGEKTAYGQGMTTVCQFSSGPRSGTSFDFRPYGVQPIPVGSPCTDGQGSNGTAVAAGPGGGGGGQFPGPAGGGGMTTVCQFSSGPRAGTRFDFRQFGVQPIPVGSPCTDGQGSNGTAVQ